jgi:putative transposase
MPRVEHRSHKGLNNHAENSHPTSPPAAPPAREGNAGLSIAGRSQRFVTVFSAVRNLFVPPNSRGCALAIHLHRLTVMAEWKRTANLAA